MALTRITNYVIKDASVSNAKLASGAVDVNKLADGAVSNAKLATGSVDADKLSSGAVSNAKLADGSVDGNKLASGAVSSSGKIASGAITNSLMPSGSVLQVIRRYDDTVSSAGSGAANYTYWLDTYITLQRSNSIIMIDGVWTGHAGDDTSVVLSYNINGGGWSVNNVLNSQAYSYSGLGDITWAHKSNNGPFPFPIHNFMNGSTIGAGAGATVGVRVGVIHENSTTFYNRGTDGQDNSVNYATARSRMSLWEIAG